MKILFKMIKKIKQKKKKKRKIHPVKSRKAKKTEEPTNVLFDSKEGSTESLFIESPKAKEIEKLENYLKGFDIRFYND